MSKQPLYPHIPKGNKPKREGIRTAYYFQSWKPKGDPTNSIPYEHGHFDSIDEALREIAKYEAEDPESFVVEIWSLEERWVPEEEYYMGQLYRSGHWDVIENTLVMYDRQGKKLFSN